MTIDGILETVGIAGADMADYLDDIARNIDPNLLNRSIVRYYRVTPATTEGQYTAFRLDGGITAILNGKASRSRVPDILITGTVTPVEIAPCETAQFYFAWHGDYVLIENSDTPIVIKAQITERAPAYLSSEIVLELKNLLLYLKTNENTSVFSTINRLSQINANAMSEMKHVKPIVKTHTLTVTPCPL